MKAFKEILKTEHPLQIVGTPNTFIALLAKEIGYRAIYLSGASIANFCHGIPDLGLTTLDNVVEETQRITRSVDLPLLVDIDTGWGHDLMIQRSIESLIRAGASGVHIEDQDIQKRCGHLEGKKVVPTEEMCRRIEAAVSAKTDSDFMVMARTDALATENLEATIARAKAYQQAGADALFAEAFTQLDQYVQLRNAISIPILANMTEFGKTPLYTIEELKSAGVDMVLYPLSAARAMNKAALETLQDIRKNGTQKASLRNMQTREELYRYLNYEGHR